MYYIPLLTKCGGCEGYRLSSIQLNCLRRRPASQTRGDSSTVNRRYELGRGQFPITPAERRQGETTTNPESFDGSGGQLTWQSGQEVKFAVVRLDEHFYHRARTAEIGICANL
jgi:hypothetical protein